MRDFEPKVYYPYTPQGVARSDESAAVVVSGCTVGLGEKRVRCAGLILRRGGLFRDTATLRSPVDGIIRSAFSSRKIGGAGGEFGCLLLRHRDDPQLTTRLYGNIRFSGYILGAVGTGVHAGEALGELLGEETYPVEVAGSGRDVNAIWMMTRRRATESPYTKITLNERVSTKIHPEAWRLYVESNPPVAPGPTLVPELKKNLAQDEAILVRQSNEFASVFTPAGFPIARLFTSNAADYVSLEDIPVSVDPALLKTGIVFTHNHPGGGSFSLADITSAAWGDESETRAVAFENGTPYIYRMLRPKAGWPRYDTITRQPVILDEALLHLIAEEKVSYDTAYIIAAARSTWALAKDLGAGYFRERLATTSAGAVDSAGFSDGKKVLVRISTDIDDRMEYLPEIAPKGLAERGAFIPDSYLEGYASALARMEKEREP